MTTRVGKNWKYTVGVLLVLVLASGCYTHENYDYKNIKIDLFEGKLSFGMINTPHEVGEDTNKQKTVSSAPYVVGFRYRRHISRKFVKMEVLNLIVSGEKTKKEIRFDKLVPRGVPDLSKYGGKEYLITNVGKGIPIEAGLDYEPLRIRATIRIYETEDLYAEQDIDYVLRTRYRRTRGLIIWAHIMSV